MTPRRWLALLGIVILAAAAAAASWERPAAAAGSSRLMVIISDLHMGVGKDGTGAWHAFEDFRWGEEFGLFLAALKTQAVPVDLVLNGDTFEVWQSLWSDCRYAGEDLGCTEAEARRRIDRVIDQHRAELRALADFARTGSNTLTIIPGNHDAVLLFPSVARAVRDALVDARDRVSIPLGGYLLSPDGLVYAEHGHQIGQEVNRFKGWPRPFIRRGSRVHVRRPWGEQFVQSYYNEFESKYPVIDNIADDRAAIRYAMAAEGRLGAVLDSAEFIEFFLLDVSWRQLAQSLGEAPRTDPVWDEAAIRRQGPQFLVESFPAGDPLRAVLAAAGPGGVPLSTDDLSSAQIRLICDHRAALAERHAKDPRPEYDVRRCPTDPPESAGAVAQYLMRAPEQVYGAHLEKLAASLGLGERPFRIFVYSHTHVADRGFNPLESTGHGWNPRVVNTGAWQRVITPQAIERKQLPPAAVLRMPLETLPPCYSLVWIAPYAETPAAELRWWRRGTDGGWGFAENCDD